MANCYQNEQQSSRLFPYLHLGLYLVPSTHFIKILIEDDSSKALQNSLITWKYLHVSSSQRAAVYFQSVKTITVLSSTQKICFKKKILNPSVQNSVLVTLPTGRRESQRSEKTKLYVECSPSSPSCGRQVLQAIVA